MTRARDIQMSSILLVRWCFSNLGKVLKKAKNVWAWWPCHPRLIFSPLRSPHHFLPHRPLEGCNIAGLEEDEYIFLQSMLIESTVNLGVQVRTRHNTGCGDERTHLVIAGSLVLKNFPRWERMPNRHDHTIGANLRVLQDKG